MKNKFISRLLLLVTAFILLNSCRNDLLPDHQETLNNSSAFKLTSKTISLNQSKHKEKLIPEIQKTENTLKKLGKTTLFGKNIEFGDGIYLDTDHVIYMENGSDYYTYTFRVIRENNLDTGPVENLVLSPYTDGSYRALLVSYDLTTQEKTALQNGEDVDTKGKTSITDLGKGNFEQLTNKNGDCGWIQTSAYTICSEGVHKKGEKSCTAAVKSVKVTVSIFVCDPNGGGSNGGGGGGSGDGSGGGGGYGENDNPIIGGNDGPCSPNGVLTGPQIPNDDIGMNPCGGGIPTIPNVENPPTPCEKLKDLLSPSKANLKPLITNGMYSYINSGSKGEAGLYLRKDSAGNITTEIAPSSDTLSLPPKWGTSYYSMAHTHPKIAYPMFSYSDMMVLYNLEMKAYQYNNGHTSFLLVCEDENGVKQTYAIVFENIGQQVEDVWAEPQNTGLEPEQVVKKMDEELKLKYDEESTKTNPNYERVFLQLNFGTNIGLYKANSDLTSWSKLTINENSDTAIVTPTNCN